MVSATGIFIVHQYPYSDWRLALWEVEPEPQLSRILHGIMDLPRKSREQLSMVVVGPHEGVCLYQEGVLREDQINAGTQTVTLVDDFVHMREIMIGGMPLDVRVVHRRGNPNYLGFADTRGMLLSAH